MFNSREHINKFRLSPTELNHLLHQLAVSIDASLASVGVNDCHLIKTAAKQFALFPITKDAQTESNETNLRYIGDVIRQFLAEHPGESYTLLLPMRMCRGYLKASAQIMKRKHAVLVEIELSQVGEVGKIQVHDSQGYLRWFLYPDKLAHIAQQHELNYQFANYHAYGVQENTLFADVVSCGYYVLEYAKHILQTGSSLGCEHIKLAIPTQFEDKYAYLTAHGLDISVNLAANSDGIEALIEEFELGDYEEPAMYTDAYYQSENAITDFESINASLFGFFSQRNDARDGSAEGVIESATVLATTKR